MKMNHDDSVPRCLNPVRYSVFEQMDMPLYRLLIYKIEDWLRRMGS